MRSQYPGICNFDKTFAPTFPLERFGDGDGDSDNSRFVSSTKFLFRAVGDLEREDE